MAPYLSIIESPGQSSTIRELPILLYSKIESIEMLIDTKDFNIFAINSTDQSSWSFQVDKINGIVEIELK